MKYTKKQLESAYEKWATQARLNPSKFMNEKDSSDTDVKEYSRLCIKALLSYIQ